MDCVDGLVVAVPLVKKDACVRFVREAAGMFSWIAWPSRAERVQGMGVFMKEKVPCIAAQGEMSFDGQRMIVGGFQRVVDA
jgi:uncharacterized protein YbaA (DUF1428 family)